MAGRVVRGLASTVVAAVAVGAFTTAAAAPAAAAVAIPTQYVAKLYSEGLGRAPDQDAWAARLAYFGANGCSVDTLREQGQDIFGSGEFQGLGYDPAEETLAAHRAVLNREPDTGGLSH